MTGAGRAVARWWFEPMPRARIAALRAILYSFVFVDVFVTTSWVAGHAHLPAALYRPLLIADLLNLPAPGPVLVPAVQAVLLTAAAVAATGRSPRLAGAVVFVAYLQWMFIAFSYGKVDHDRVAFLVALAVLPTVGSARWSDRRSDEASGWAIRCIQVAVVLTYLLAAFAKLRFGGLEWLNGATLMRAVLRRGTSIGDLLIDAPALLQAAQYGIVVFELASPVMLLRNKLGRTMVAVAAAFHAMTYATIGIIFLPHVVSMLAFVPLEDIRMPGRIKRRLRPQEGVGWSRTRLEG